MTLDKLNPNDLFTIVENMREWDRREIFATRWDENPHDLVRDAMGCYDFGWIASHDDRPICAIGGAPIHPGVWSVWMFATDEFHKIKFSMTRFALRRIKPVLQDVAHRIECKSMEGHEDAQMWLTFLGMKRESALEQYGKNGERFFVYSLLNPKP